MKSYITKNGDTWDKIAYDQLGSEYLLPILLKANPQYRTILKFDSGNEILIPEFDQVQIMATPPWLTEVVNDLNGGEENDSAIGPQSLTGADLQ